MTEATKQTKRLITKLSQLQAIRCVKIASSLEMKVSPTLADSIETTL